MAEEQETLQTIAERQRRLETGQLILSTHLEQLIEELRALGGDNLPSKFLSREQRIAAIAERIRQAQRAGGIVATWAGVN